MQNKQANLNFSHLQNTMK